MISYIIEAEHKSHVVEWLLTQQLRMCVAMGDEFIQRVGSFFISLNGQTTHSLGNIEKPVHTVGFTFLDEKDAILFKLRWSDYIVDASDDDASRKEI